MSKMEIDSKKLDEIMSKLKNMNIDTKNCGGCLEDLNISKDVKSKDWKRMKNKR